MKKVFACLFALFLCLPLSGCGGEQEYVDPGEVDEIDLDGVPSLGGDDSTGEGATAAD